MAGSATIRSRLLLLTTVLLLLLVSVVVGCTSTIRGPSGVPEAERVTVHLVTNARHSGILLPGAEPGVWIEYAFGEFSWYAQNRDSWYRVFPTVLWPTTGCLGRAEFRAPDEATLLDRLRPRVLDAVVVDRRRVAQLRDRLEHVYWDPDVERIPNRRYGYEFRRYRSYWMGWSCHDETAEWFEALDCAVTWRPVRFWLEIAELEVAE